MNDTPEQEYSCKLLKEPLSVTDLISGGAKFEINTDFDDVLSEELFDDFNVGSDNENDEEFEKKVNDSSLVSPWTKPFDELRTQMTKVNEHIYKTIIKAGKASEETVGDNSRVCIHYNAYWEGEGAPFDSTYLRGSATKFYTGLGEVLEGVEAAVRTMRCGEQAQFLISYKLLFREIGCPPRVKPRADGLYIIELVSCNVVGNMDADKELSAEDRNKFSVVVEKVKEIHLKGLDFYKSGLYRNACRVFEKAVDVLNYCRLADEQEEREHRAFLIKLYTNLAVCYNKVKLPARTCLMCKEIRRLTQDKSSCKALFQEGRALLLLGDFVRARTMLVRAQQMEPHNTEINAELRLLENTYNTYMTHQKSMWSKAMGNLSINGNKPAGPEPHRADEPSAQETWEATMTDTLKSFKNDTRMAEFFLPPGLTHNEVDYVRRLANSMGLTLGKQPSSDNCYKVHRM